MNNYDRAMMDRAMRERNSYDSAMRARNNRRDYARNDYRNPYGSAGGYVVSGRNYDRAYDRNYDAAMYDYDDYTDYEQPYNDYNDYDMRYDERNYRMDNYHGYYGDTPFEMMRRRSYRGDMRRRDYDDEEKSLRREDLEKWAQKLMSNIDMNAKESFKKERVMRRAEELGIKFDKFTPEELYVTTLMLFTDYFKTLGNSNTDLYIKLAKDWLCDDDVEAQYGKKLAIYYKKIVKEDD